MSVYRLHSAGAWTQASHIDQLQIQLDLIPAYNDLTNHIFHADFNMLANRLRHVIATSQAGHVAKAVTKPVALPLPRLLNYLPPVFMMLVRTIVPPALKQSIVKILHGSRVV